MMSNADNKAAPIIAAALVGVGVCQVPETPVPAPTVTAQPTRRPEDEHIIESSDTASLPPLLAGEQAPPAAPRASGLMTMGVG